MTTKRVILKIGYTQFIMEAKAATALFSSLVGEGMELYESKWNQTTKLNEPRVRLIPDDLVTLSILTPELYAMGKLLQKAEDVEKQSNTQGE